MQTLEQSDRRPAGSAMSQREPLFKDAVLDCTAAVANVAQFVSFGPDLEQRFSRISEFRPNHVFPSIERAVAVILDGTPEKSVNVRSFDPLEPESREFAYGLKEVKLAVDKVRQLAQKGLYTIVNETVDVNDGGVSGVVLGDVVEFAPKDTPRCVEQPGVASLPRELGLRMLTTVYGFTPDLDYAPSQRVEFSLHPTRRGVRHGHTIVWQVEDVGEYATVPAVSWPNRFSRFIGDKAFGLLVADGVGVSVPWTTVIPRWLPPFRFGSSTGTGETWIRTCPTEQRPGKYTTASRWLDPFELLQDEDPDQGTIASVLAQEGVDSRHSGALAHSNEGAALVEGVRGRGDDFMLGERGPESLPRSVVDEVTFVAATLRKRLGPIRMEWVHDGTKVWIVQLHRGATQSHGQVIVPGDVPRYRRFHAVEGIEALRVLAAEAKSSGEGVTIVGNVGITSHFGDILRKLGVPSTIERPRENA